MNKEQLYKISDYLGLSVAQVAAAEMILDGVSVYGAEKAVYGQATSTMARTMRRINEVYELSNDIHKGDK